MQTIDVIQGSDEWHALRRECCNASEAPVIMGASSKMRRDELLAMKKFGVEREVGEFMQRLFDKGHEAERSIRPHIEILIGDDLYPATGIRNVDGIKMLASFDGITMLHDVQFEHKIYNAALFESVNAGIIPDEHCWQLEHQLMVSGAEASLFVVSDGTPEKMRHARYTSQPDRRKRLYLGWKQFLADLEAYEHQPEVLKPEAAPTIALPAPSIRVDGSIALISNLDVFGQKLREFIDGINMAPEDDQGFVDAEAAVKTLTKAQEALQLAESSALAQTASIDEMRRTVALYVDMARTTRLSLEKVVKTQKETIRTNLVSAARAAINEHLALLNKGLGGQYLEAQSAPADFVGCIKSKRTITSIRSALNDELARTKIVANELAEKIRANLQTLTEHEDYRFLFNDLRNIINKEPTDFALLVNDRVGRHKKAEEDKLEAERERIRLEEQAKAEAKVRAEAEAKAKADAEAKAKENAARATSVAPVFQDEEAAKPIADQEEELIKAHIAFQAPPQAEAQQKIYKVLRPTDLAIIRIIASYYRANEYDVIEWIREMDLEAAVGNLAEAS